MGDFRVLNGDLRVGEMGSFCRNGGAEEEGGGVGVSECRSVGVSGFREEYPGGRAWGEAGVERRTGKLDEIVFT